jgi:hypothetical protein
MRSPMWGAVPTPNGASPMVLDILRRVVFHPYRKGAGPVFTLTVWDANKTGYGNKSMLGYRLKASGKTIFQGEDFGCSPLHAIDSDEVIKGIMSS